MDIGDMEGRGTDILQFSFSIMNIDLLSAAHWLEDISIFPGSFTFPQKEISALLQRRMKDGDQCLLKHRLEINHHIPAADQIQPPKRRVRQHIVGSENDHPADLLGYNILFILLCKISGQPLWRNILQDTLRKDSLSCLFDGPGIYICSKNLHITCDSCLFHDFTEQNSKGIRLLTGGTSGAPYTDSLVFVGVFYKGIHSILLQFFKIVPIPEKAGNTDQDFLSQSIALLFIAFQEIHVFRKTAAVGHHHSSLQPPQDRRPFIIGKIYTA